MGGMRGAWLALALAVACAPAAGQFGCPGCAKEWTQLANNGQLVHIAAQEVEQLATQIQQYRQMVRHGIPLQPWQVRDVMGDLARLNRILNQGQGIATDAGEFDRRFRQAYQGYEMYAAATRRDYASAYRRWNDMRMDAVRDAYYAAGLHASSFRDEDAAAREIERQMQTAAGQMQVLQASGAIARMEVEQLMKLRQLMAVQIKLQGDAIAADAERQAAADAEDERIRAERRKSIESARRYLEENPMCTGCIGLDGKPMGMPPE